MRIGGTTWAHRRIGTAGESPPGHDSNDGARASGSRTRESVGPGEAARRASVGSILAGRLGAGPRCVPTRCHRTHLCAASGCVVGSPLPQSDSGSWTMGAEPDAPRCAVRPGPVRSGLRTAQPKRSPQPGQRVGPLANFRPHAGHSSSSASRSKPDDSRTATSGAQLSCQCCSSNSAARPSLPLATASQRLVPQVPQCSAGGRTISAASPARAKKVCNSLT